MKRALLPQILICCAGYSVAQFKNSFPFGGITAEDVEMKSYAKDTSAWAVVLNEFGEAYIDSDGVDKELNQDEDFGMQIKKGRNAWESKVAEIAGSEQDPLKKAPVVYTLIKDWFVWNDTYGKYSESGLKKAFEARKEMLAISTCH